MKKIISLLLFSAFLCACSDSDNQSGPLVIVEEVPSELKVFAPGEEITIVGKYFQENDRIRLGGSGSTKTSEVITIATIITKRTETSITFLAPSGFPAMQHTAILWRGEKSMNLCQVNVSDGCYPNEFSLYGITPMLTSQTAIDKIDMTTGEVTPIATTLEPQTLRCIADGSQLNSVVGLTGSAEGFGCQAYYNMTMHYFDQSDSIDAIVAGIDNLGRPLFLTCIDNRLLLDNWTNTRMYMPQPSSWKLPSGITSSMLGRNAFINCRNGLLLSTKFADNSFAPLVIVYDNIRTVKLDENIQEVDEMIPFSVILQNPDDHVYYVVGAFALVKNGSTKLQLYDSSKMEFGEVLATIPATVRSVAVLNVDSKSTKIFLLCDTASKKRKIHIYNISTDEVTLLPGEFNFSEIATIK